MSVCMPALTTCRVEDSTKYYLFFCNHFPTLLTFQRWLQAVQRCPKHLSYAAVEDSLFLHSFKVYNAAHSNVVSRRVVNATMWKQVSRYKFTFPELQCKVLERLIEENRTPQRISFFSEGWGVLNFNCNELCWRTNRLRRLPPSRQSLHNITVFTF